MHGIAYDAIHDEIVAPSPFAEAVLIYRGDAAGNQMPVRIIQGPKTLLGEDAVAIDPVNNEIYATRGDAVLVYPREANGDVAPIRILRGPRTQIRKALRMAIDPVNNLLVVADDTLSKPGLFIFDRTASGDTPPLRVITGPATGIVRPQAVQVDPPRKQIIVAITDRVDGPAQKAGFIGVWNYEDEGNVPPKATISGRNSTIQRPRGVTFSAEKQEVYVVDMRRNALLTFRFPQIFQPPPARAAR
jgi:DNA-binding beta-propeller fold protein YncE